MAPVPSTDIPGELTICVAFSVRSLKAMEVIARAPPSNAPLTRSEPPSLNLSSSDVREVSPLVALLTRAIVTSLDV